METTQQEPLEDCREVSHKLKLLLSLCTYYLSLSLVYGLGHWPRHHLRAYHQRCKATKWTKEGIIICFGVITYMTLYDCKSPLMLSFNSLFSSETNQFFKGSETDWYRFHHDDPTHTKEIKKRAQGACNAPVNNIPHYPTPVLYRGIDQ